MRTYPSILEKNKRAIESKLKQVSGLVSEVQIDICDGRFVPSKTFGSAGCFESIQEIAGYAKKYKCELELDLMINLDYSNRMDRWHRALTDIQAERIIFHIGVTKEWGTLFTGLVKRKKLVSEIGLGVHLDNPNKEIFDLLDSYPFSFVQVMGIEKVGYSGQKFSSKTYTKIKAIRKRYPDMEISVDGGVSILNAEKLQQAGATRICPNSGLFKTGNISSTLTTFREI